MFASFFILGVGGPLLECPGSERSGTLRFADADARCREVAQARGSVFAPPVLARPVAHPRPESAVSPHELLAMARES